MDYLEESDLDSTVTPIEGQSYSHHGEMIESDSLSDFLLHEDRKARKHKHGQREKPLTHNAYESDNDVSSKAGNFKEIYKELQIISDKLKNENKILRDREQKLRERERLVSISTENLKTINDHEIKQTLQAMEEKYVGEISRLEMVLKEKNKENKRLKESFETLKLANDALKKDFECLQSQHVKLEKQAVSVQARLTNLQRKKDFEQRQKEFESVPSMSTSTSVPKQKWSKDGEDKSKFPKQPKQPSSTCGFDVVSFLLDWICDTHLRSSITEQPTKPVERFSSTEYIQEKVFKVQVSGARLVCWYQNLTILTDIHKINAVTKTDSYPVPRIEDCIDRIGNAKFILPSLVDMLKEFPGQNLKLSVPCLQFIYWSLIHIEQSQAQQKNTLSSTFRRLGEELYRGRTVRFIESDRISTSMSGGENTKMSPVKTEKVKDGIYFRSSNLHVRLLSSLIILKTLTQVDLLAQVFDVLRNDLKSDIAKELYLYYQSTPVVLQYLKPINKTFIGTAIDIFLQMSTDSPFQQPFLESCSNESWFRTIAMVLRAPNQEQKLLEKLSIILQKLSKLKANRKYFEVYTIVGIIQELLRSCPTEQAFLALNLKSILFNLTTGTGQLICT